MKWNNVTLERGITTDMDLWSGGPGRARWDRQGPDARDDHDVQPGRQTDCQMGIPRAWPSKLTGPTANATNNEVGIEEMEITHEGYKRTQ